MKLKYPNLFVVGVMRGGTTSLFDYLGQHPEIFKPAQKGVEYFVDPKSPEKIKLLKVLYEDWRNEKYAINASHYFHDENACKNIKKLVPNAKIMISLRKSKDALRSLYNYHVASGEVEKNISFEEWMKRNPEIIKHYDYKRNIKLWKKNFGKNVKIIKFESWIRNPVKTCQEIFRFLGIDDKFEPKIRVLNKAEFTHPPRRIIRRIVSIFPKWIRLWILKRIPLSKKVYQKILYGKLLKGYKK